MLHHHAQLIEGNSESLQTLLLKIEKELGLNKNHPDLSIFEFINEKLGIDDATKIRHAILRSPSSAPQNIIVIYAGTLTEVAQNSLLKIFEEPPKNSYIFLITTFIPHLLPTLRSRFIEFKIDSTDKKAHDHDNSFDNSTSESLNELLNAENFIKSKIEKRLAIVKDIHSAMDKGSISIGEVWNFVNKIELYFINSSADKKDVLMRAQEFMHAPGNSVKMLLEYLAVRL